MLPNDTGLSEFSVSTGEVRPSFAPTNTTYRVFVDHNVSSLTFTFATRDPNAVIELRSRDPNDPEEVYDNDPMTDGIQVDLQHVRSALKWTVRARDGVTTANYSVQTLRANPPATNARLRELSLNGATIEGFDSRTYTYTVTALSGSAETIVAALPLDQDATTVTKLNGVEDDDGTVDLVAGSNTITVEVTAEDGTTMETYTVTITAPAFVPTSWSLIPSGLGDGDSFRLLFIGSSNSNANSSDIDVYNTFVQNLVATKGHEDIQAHSATFRMLGSTEDVDARDNTETTGTGVPIYWLGGAKVADDYADFYDGDWDEEATGRRENGDSVSIGTDWKIWTGSAHDGTEAMDTGSSTSRALGNSNNAWVMQGSPNGSDSTHGPIQSNTAGRGTNRGVYGLSDVFTVDASLDVDPPGAPQNFEATAGTGKVTLTWDAPASEGGGEITHYEYQRKEGSGDYGDWTTAETVEFGTDSHSAILRDATTLDHYDVKAETTYTYRVRAVNAGGGGDASGEGSATTGAAMTVRIEASPQRVMEDEGTVTVTATVVAEMPATGPNTEKYDLEFVVSASTLPGTASFGTGDFSGFNVDPVFAPDDFEMESGSWVAEKTYTVTITDDDIAEQDENFRVEVRSAEPTLTLPRHPFVTIPSDTDDVTITIANDDHLPEIPDQEFDVLLGETDAGLLPDEDEDGDTLTWTLTGGDDENLFTLSSEGQLSLKMARTSLENPGDDNGDGVYELTVTVSDGHHAPVSGPITVRLFDVTKPPRTPGAPWVRALDGSTDALDVRWPEIQGEAVRSYDLRYRKDGGGDWTDGPQDVAETRAEITGLESGTPYEVQVRATNSRGDSGWSPSTTGYPATVYDIDGIYIYWTDRQGSEELHDDVLILDGEYTFILGDGEAPLIIQGLDQGNTLGNACDTGESFRAYWLQPLESRDADEWEADVQTIDGTGTAQYRLRTPPELTGVVSLDGFTVIGIRIRGRFGEDWSNWSRAVNLICVPTEDDSGSATGNSSTGSENATGTPLAGFELVDATAHLDAGAVDDGMTLTDIDPDKVYGFRANIVPGTELKSVKLELRGPGADDVVKRTENYRPYSLHGDSNGEEHGAALAAGSYTLTATAYSETKGGGSQLGTFSVEFTVAGWPLTVSFEGLPQTGHGGQGTPFTFRLVFSEAVSITPEALREHALKVTNATIEAVSRVDDRSDLWEVRLTPESDAMVTVSLSPPADCDAAGAVCTEDGRMLSFGAGRVILGPPPNTLATGAPAITGTAQVGQTLTADTSGIDDEDGLNQVVFSYQWIRNDGNADEDIAGATGSSYTLTEDDEGKTVKVEVSCTDDGGNPETRTSDATGEVESQAGPLSGFTLVDAADADQAVLWKHQTDGSKPEEGDRWKEWTDGGTLALGDPQSGSYGIRADTESGEGIHRVALELTLGSTGEQRVDRTDDAAPYSLYGDEGEDALHGESLPVGSYTLKATAYTEDGETLGSLEVSFTVALAKPGSPQDLEGEATAQEIKLTWKAPSGFVVTHYVIYRGVLRNGSMNGQALSKHATIDAAGKAMSYTDDNVEEGAEYRYRVAAVNTAGEGKKSNWLDIEAG